MAQAAMAPKLEARNKYRAHKGEAKLEQTSKPSAQKAEPIACQPSRASKALHSVPKPLAVLTPASAKVEESERTVLPSVILCLGTRSWFDSVGGEPIAGSLSLSCGGRELLVSRLLRLGHLKRRSKQLHS